MTHPNPSLPLRYRLLHRLGKGNVGEVWCVVDTLAPEAPRALKRIKADAGDFDKLTLRFRAEFHAMARLRHPNIVAVHDYGIGPDDAVFMVMDLVKGQDLSDVIGTKPLPLDTFY